MPEGRRFGWTGLTVLAALILVGSEGIAWAGCGTCQVCRERTSLTIPRDFCDVANNEHGYLCCTPESIGPATYCWESGSACYGTNAGGGGGGDGEGGGECTYQNGWCPATCMSCTEDGDRRTF